MTGDDMMRNGAPTPRFASKMRGYDRGQVDAYVAENARWGAEAWGRVTDLEARLSELEGSEAPQRLRQNVERTIEEARQTLDLFVEKIDAKATELENTVRDATRPQLDELRASVQELEDERRSALDGLARARETLHGFHPDRGLGNGQEPHEPTGDQAQAQNGAPVPTSSNGGEPGDQ